MELTSNDVVKTVSTKKSNTPWYVIIGGLLIAGVVWAGYGEWKSSQTNPLYGMTKEQAVVECQYYLSKSTKDAQDLLYWREQKNEALVNIFTQSMYHYTQSYDKFCK